MRRPATAVEPDLTPDGIRDPNPILLINAEVEWPEERLARLHGPALADDPALGQIALGEVN